MVELGGVGVPTYRNWVVIFAKLSPSQYVHFTLQGTISRNLFLENMPKFPGMIFEKF